MCTGKNDCCCLMCTKYSPEKMQIISKMSKFIKLCTVCQKKINLVRYDAVFDENTGRTVTKTVWRCQECGRELILIVDPSSPADYIFEGDLRFIHGLNAFR